MQSAGALGTIASGAFSIIGGMNQIDAASMTSSVNTTLDMQRAQTAQLRAKADAQDIQRQTERAIGSVRAGASASGLVASEGSPLEAALDNAATGELNRQRRLWAGEMEARDHMVDAYGEQMKGWQGAQRGYAMIPQGISSLLTGGSKMYDLLGGFGVGASGGLGGEAGSAAKAAAL
jgi:hypothetical protein